MAATWDASRELCSDCDEIIRRLLESLHTCPLFTSRDQSNYNNEFSEVRDSLRVWKNGIDTGMEQPDIRTVDLANRQLTAVKDHLNVIERQIYSDAHTNAAASRDARESIDNRLQQLQGRQGPVANLSRLWPTTVLLPTRGKIEKQKNTFDDLKQHFQGLIQGETQPYIGKKHEAHLHIGEVFAARLLEKLPAITNCHNHILPPTYQRLSDGLSDRDGYVTNEDEIAAAQRVLEAFGQAWCCLQDQASLPGLKDRMNGLRRAPKIVMTLKAMIGLKWIDNFLHFNVDDSVLFATPTPGISDMRRTNLRDVFRGNDILVNRFLHEQRRIMPRSWGSLDHFDMDDNEPLPFCHRLPYSPTRGSGTYSTVHFVKDSFSSREYALKITKMPGNRDSEKHLKNDAKRLLDICDDCNKARIPHLVRVKNTFKRAGYYGMLIEPLADNDLKTLLLEISDNARTDQALLYEIIPALIKAIGCLSRTLFYLHDIREVRHRDIKPGNILYQASKGDNLPNFLFSDFGVARSVAEATTTAARTGTKGYFQGTVEYAAHEQFSEEKRHGRSADVWSFGLVVFEILHAVMYQKHSRDKERFPQRLWPYHEKLDQLHDEIEQMIQGEWSRCHPHLNALAEKSNGIIKHARKSSGSCAASTTWKGPSLKPLLELVIRMTDEDAPSRPKALEVMRELRKMHNKNLELFCPSCLQAAGASDEELRLKNQRRGSDVLWDWSRHRG